MKRLSLGILVRTLLLLLITFSMPSPSATAQVALTAAPDANVAVPAVPDPLTPEAVRELVSRLSDQEVRTLLLDRLDAVARTEAGTNRPSALATLRESLSETASSIGETVDKVPAIGPGVARGVANFVQPRGWDGVGRLLGLPALAILIGLIAERLILRLRGRWQGRAAQDLPETLGQTLVLLVKRAFFEGMGLIAFF